MGFPILNLPSQWGCKISKSVANHAAELGNGYQQVAIIGTVPITETWEIESTDLTNAQLADVLGDLETFSGDTVFYWSPDEGQYPLRSFTCSEWKRAQIAPGRWIVRGVLEYEPTGQCLAYANLIDASTAKTMAEAAVGFLSTYTRDTAPFIANAQGVNRNNFHDVLGRGGYLPPSAGTTEGQATLIRSLLRLRSTPGISAATQATCLSLANLYGNALLTYFYPITPPTDGNTFYPAHWVINAGPNSFVSKGLQTGKPENYGHFGVTVAFTGGVGNIPAGVNEGNKVGEVFRVYKTTGKLVWKSVTSGLLDNADNLPISYWVSNLQLAGTNYRFYPDYQIPGAAVPAVTAETPGKIVLSSGFTGDAIVVYSSYTGPNIAKNQRFDAFPMWRPMNAGESNVAFDSLWWLFDCFDELYTATGLAQWQRARDCTKFTAISAATIQNESYLFKRDLTTTEPFSYPGTQLISINNTAPSSVVRVADGSMLVTVADGPELYPSSELQNFVITTGITATATITAELASSVACIAEIVVSISPNPLDQTRKYTYWQPLPATLATFTNVSLTPGQLVQWPTQTVWHPTNSDAPIYTYSGGGGSAVTVRELQTVDGLTKLVQRVNMAVGGGFAGAGFVLQGTVINKPPAIYYKSTGSVRLRVTDSNAAQFTWALPPSPTWALFTPDFASSSNTAVPGDGLITAVELVPIGTSEVSIYWLGAAPVTLPFPVRCYKHSVVIRQDGAYQYKVGNVQAVGSSLNVLKYQPAAVPFTANTTNGVVDSWRGTLYASYQSPSSYLKWGYPDRALLALQCLSDSQSAYSSQSLSGLVGPFAPTYIWNLWSELNFGSPVDTWGWDGPDPSSNWTGYQVRPLADVAELWYADKQNVLASAIVMRFIGYLDKLYRQNNSGQPPTNFNPQSDPTILYHEPHAAGFIMQAAIYANLSGGNSAQTFRVIKRSWEYIQSQYVSSGIMAGSFAKGQPTFGAGFNQYFGFWHGQLCESIALLIKYKDALTLPSCSEQV